MREQIGHPYRQTGQGQRIQRQSLVPQQAASRHRVGHNAGLHPEDTPFLSDDLIEDDSYYETRPPTSARRYVTAEGNAVIQKGNRRVIIHQEPPPKRKAHWLLILGVGMILTIFLLIGVNALETWWTNHQLDSTYGMPRTYQTDQVVGHGDSADHPTHFIFENLGGHVVIIELPAGQISHARIYGGPTLYSDNAASIPVTADFKDVNGDGKVDMVVVIQDQRIVFINDGTQFKPQQ